MNNLNLIIMEVRSLEIPDFRLPDDKLEQCKSPAQVVTLLSNEWALFENRILYTHNSIYSRVPQRTRKKVFDFIKKYG